MAAFRGDQAGTAADAVRAGNTSGAREGAPERPPWPPPLDAVHPPTAIHPLPIQVCPLNDAAETLAIKQVFGDHALRVPVSGTKALHRHVLGASGAIEAAICMLALQHA